MTRALAVGAALLVGAVLLVWPALLNGYPLVFSDTGAFLAQTVVPLMIWDKPYVYGPFLHLFHWRLTLWLPLAAQALVISHLLWLTERVLRGNATPSLHLAVCAGLAALTTAPFTIALLMPDALAPVVVLCLFLLGFARDRLSRGEAWYVGALGAFAIASHLSHLPLAAALVALVLLVRRQARPALRTAVPVVAAVAVLLATNAVGHGRASLSPYGATFLLARLQADGPAAAVVRESCPESGWYLCAFADRLPMDSDEFLWAPDSPVNRDPEGRTRFLGGMLLAEEARAILAETFRRYPLEVAAAMLGNAATQLVTARAGDTLGDEHLQVAVRRRLVEAFPAREVAAFDAGLQARDALRAAVEPLLWVHVPVLLLSAPLALLAWWRAAREGDRRRLGFLLCVLVGVTANAFATGALSKPHHRYEARILWLLPLAATLGLLPQRAGSGASVRTEAQARGAA